MSENIHFNFSIRRFHLGNPIFKIIQRLKKNRNYELRYMLYDMKTQKKEKKI